MPRPPRPPLRQLSVLFSPGMAPEAQLDAIGQVIAHGFELPPRASVIAALNPRDGQILVTFWTGRYRDTAIRQGPGKLQEFEVQKITAAGREKVAQRC